MPDDLRATVYNLFRVPLNLIVVVINVVSLSSEFTFLVRPSYSPWFESVPSACPPPVVHGAHA